MRRLRGAPTGIPTQPIRDPLEGRVAAMEVGLRKLLQRFEIDEDDYGLESTMAATPAEMVATPKIDHKTVVETPKLT